MRAQLCRRRHLPGLHRKPHRMTVTALCPLDEGSAVGLDSLDPVVNDYGTERRACTGDIEKVMLAHRPGRGTEAT